MGRIRRKAETMTQDLKDLCLIDKDTLEVLAEKEGE
jgi:hypothetical protein